MKKIEWKGNVGFRLMYIIMGYSFSEKKTPKTCSC